MVVAEAAPDVPKAGMRKMPPMSDEERPGFLRRWLLNRILRRFNAANAADAAAPGPTDAPLEGMKRKNLNLS